MTITFDVVSDFNHTGVQPEAGNPFTYGTETALNVGFTPFSYFVNTNHSGLTSEHTNDGTLDNWYFLYQLAGPDVGVVATGGTLTFGPGSFFIPNDVLMMMPGSFFDDTVHCSYRWSFRRRWFLHRFAKGQCRPHDTRQWGYRFS